MSKAEEKKTTELMMKAKDFIPDGVYSEEELNLAFFMFIKGYHQAEKDLELTWEDIKEICVQSVLVETDLGGLVSDERHYTEVLKRFKEERNSV